jgi:hypothetical protein
LVCNGHMGKLVCTDQMGKFRCLCKKRVPKHSLSSILKWYIIMVRFIMTP